MTNKHNDPQADRDHAQRDKLQAQTAKAATVDGDRAAVDQASKQGNGPAGLNTGPSDTVSRDPHNPIDGRPLYGNQPSSRSDGMGQSPPHGARPTSDRPEGHDPHAARAAQSGSPEAQKAADANAADRKAATDAERDADQRLSKANDRLADKQGEGEGDKQRKEAHKPGK